MAWDNNDFDPHAAIASATHLGQIGASAHQHMARGFKTLGLESLWMKVEDITLSMLKRGRDETDHRNILDAWHKHIFRILGDSPRYLQADGDDQCCLEMKLQDTFVAAKCIVTSINLFLQSGSTKCLADCEEALTRIQRCCHAQLKWKKVGRKWESTVTRRALVEGDEETYRIMVKLRQENPEKYKWLLPHPGGWHIMLHVTKALMTKYYGAGIEEVTKTLGGDDKHAAAGSKYRRSHHFLPVTYEAMWWIVIERYDKATGNKVLSVVPESSAPATVTPATANPAREGGGDGDDDGDVEVVDVESDVIPCLREQAKEHKTSRFWAAFLLEDYPVYLAFRTGGRTANYKLCVAAFRELAPLFAGTGKNRYQKLASWHLRNLARMTDDDLEAICSLFSSQYNTKNYKNFNNVFLDEFEEMTNKTSKQSVSKISSKRIEHMAPICDSRRVTVDEVDARLYPSCKERDVRRVVIRSRVRGIKWAKAVLENYLAFSVEGKEQLRSLGGAGTTQRREDAMLNWNQLAADRFDDVLRYEGLGDYVNGTKPSNTKLPRSAAGNTPKSTKTPPSASAARKDFRDMSTLALEFRKIITNAMGEHDMNPRARCSGSRR